MKYLKLFENYNHLDDIITKIQLLDSDDEENDEKIDENTKNEAIEFVKQQYELNQFIPYFVAPTVNLGVLVEYKKDSIRIDIRFEKKESVRTVIFESGRLLYNDVFNQEMFDSYLR